MKINKKHNQLFKLISIISINKLVKKDQSIIKIIQKNQIFQNKTDN